MKKILLSLFAAATAVTMTAETVTYQLVNCTSYPKEWGWNSNYIVNPGKKIEATLTLDDTRCVISNWDGDGHELNFTINADSSVTLNNGTLDEYGYYTQTDMTGKYSAADVYVPYITAGHYFDAVGDSAYVVIPGYFHKDQNDKGTWGEIYLACGSYETTVWEPSEEPETEADTLLFSKTAYYVDGANFWGSEYATYTDDEVQLGFPVEVDVYSHHVVLHNFLHSSDPNYKNFSDLDITYDAKGYSTAIGGTAETPIAGYFYTGLKNMYYLYMDSSSATIKNGETSGYVYIYAYFCGDTDRKLSSYLITWDPEVIAPYVNNPTSIKGIEANAEQSVVYNLFGQQAKKTKGFVVKDGVKMIVK